MSTSHPLSRLRVRLTKQINKLGFMFPQIFQGCIKPPLGPDQDHRERRVGFTCIDLINSVAASLANCEAKESAEVNGFGLALDSVPQSPPQKRRTSLHMSPRLLVVFRYCITLRLSQITGCVAAS